MKLSIKQGGGLPYARKEPYEYDGKQYEADLKDGDIVKILDSGETEMGTFGEQTVFKIKTRNGDKKLSFNQATINVLVKEFGEETENWINKDVKVILDKKIIANKKAIVPYLVTSDWEIDEYGELFKEKKEGEEGVNIPF
jgi:archaellum component FlaG (FlaF/FlaG flagellin family)